MIGFGLCALVERHLFVGEVCGLGVFWVIELVCDCEICELLVLFNVLGLVVFLMMEFAVVCKVDGFWPFVYFN